MTTTINDQRSPASARPHWAVWLVASTVLAAMMGGARTTAQAADGYPFEQHLPAPPLTGGTEWLNSDAPIRLADLRGKFVLLDFWTYCCINCMHVLPRSSNSNTPFPTNWW